MKHAYDTEFLENGVTIELISIAIVCEDGREYYAVNADMPVDRITKRDWLMQHVVPYLPGSKPYRLDGNGSWIWSLNTRDTCVKPKWVIANEVRDFLLGGGEPPELWAYYGAYDHIVLCQLFGSMMALPKGIPMFTHDIMQAMEQQPGFTLPPTPQDAHNALADARWTMGVLRALRIVPTVVGGDR